MCLGANCQEQYFGSSTSILSFFWKYQNPWKHRLLKWASLCAPPVNLQARKILIK